MPIVIYSIGALSFVSGLALFIPTAMKVLQLGDPVMIVGAPIFMNGISLCLFGVVIGALGRAIDLLQRTAHPKSKDAVFEEMTAILSCPKCSQQLRVPKGKKGALVCPKCTFKFEAES